MSYFLVAPALEMSLELFPSDQLERAMSLQWERLKERDARDAFVRRIEKQLETLLPDAIDWDIKEPTPAQVSYAMAIAKQIGVPIPSEALRFRGVMHDFLETHVPQAKAKWDQKATIGSKAPE
jgi:hypothetical protein